MRPGHDDRRREVDDEFAFHLEMRTRQFMAEGLTREEAQRRAAAAFGDHRTAQAACRTLAELRDTRQARQARWASWGDDLRDSLRRIRRHPAPAAAVLAMLTIGVALTVAALTLALAVLRAELPYPDADALVALQGRLTQEGRTQNWPAGYLDMVDLQEGIGSQLLLASHSAARPLNRQTAAGADVVHAEMVSASYFAVLGTGAVQGRVFTPAEDQRAAAAPVVVLSDEFWRARLGAADTALGSTVVLNERGYTVVGIMPRGFRGITDRADVWLPVNAGAAIYNPNYINARQLRWVTLIGRLGDGVTMTQGAEVLRRASDQLAERYPQANDGLVFEPQPLEERIFGTMPLSLYAASAGAALVMLLVFVNIGGLSLARAVATQRDLAVRRALGASPGRLLRQSAIQWTVVALVAALSAMMMAPAVVAGVLASGAFRLPSFVDASMPAGMMAGIGVLAALGVLVAIVAPVLVARGVPLSAMGSGGRTSAPPFVMRLGRLVIFAQVAVAAALMFTGVLMIRSVWHLQDGALGWNPTHVASMRIDLLGARYTDQAVKQQLAERLLENLGDRVQVPMALSGAGGVPTGELFLTRPTIEDYRPPAGEATPWLSWHMVTPAYFDVLGIELRAGRVFTPADRADAQRVAIVTESLARRFWPDTDPVGRRLKLGNRDNPNVPWATIVGVVADVDFEAHARDRDLSAHEHLFVPFAQVAPSQPARAHLLVKTASLLPVAEAARAALQEVAPTLPLHAPVVLRDALEQQTVRDRLIAAILALFGGVALVVSAVGIYCTVAFEVARRAPEYGVRLALGAARLHIVRLATLDTMVVVSAGLAAGLMAGAALATWGRALLFGIQPIDALTTALVGVVLPAAAVLGMWRPLRKAASTDPASVLRQS